MPALCQDICDVIKVRNDPRVKAPEWRALEQIVAEARAAGRQVVTLGPAGIFEIVPHATFPSDEIDCGVEQSG